MKAFGTLKTTKKPKKILLINSEQVLLFIKNSLTQNNVMYNSVKQFIIRNKKYEPQL